ncbi:ice nucleation protein, partial [Podospora aff. communis PSN243]
MAGWIASVLVLLAASRLGTAQKTYCNPTVNTCPPVPALGTSISVDFTTSESSLGPYVNQVNGPLTFDQKGNGLTLLIMNEFDFPQAGISKYIFYGRVDVTMRTAPGIGIATSFVLQSDDLDEIQFEWVGADLDRNVTRTNYFSKGCTATYDRGTVFTTVNHTGEYHTYSIDWTPEKVEWLVNGQVMRALTAENADRTVCGRFPQSPMRILVGSWVPGKAAAPAGTIDWAGGLADFSKGPSSTYIRGINVTDTANGVEGAKQYRHRDMSGIAANVVVETS